MNRRILSLSLLLGLVFGSVLFLGCEDAGRPTSGFPRINEDNGNPITHNPIGTPVHVSGGVNISIGGEYENDNFDNYHPEGCPPEHENSPNGQVVRPSTATLADESVDRISIRSVPIEPYTVDEIVRILKPGCTVTIAGPDEGIIATDADEVISGLGPEYGGSDSGSTLVSGVVPIYWKTIRKKPR